jgi:hypothetical protein
MVPATAESGRIRQVILFVQDGGAYERMQGRKAEHAAEGRTDQVVKRLRSSSRLRMIR